MSDSSNRTAKNYIKSKVMSKLNIDNEILLICFLDHWNNRQNIFMDKEAATDLRDCLNEFLAG